MPDHRSEGRVLSADSYASALCMTCTWKLSGADEQDTPAIVRRDSTVIEREAERHAEEAGHHVSLIVTKHLTIDYRVERHT